MFSTRAPAWPLIGCSSIRASLSWMAVSLLDYSSGSRHHRYLCFPDSREQTGSEHGYDVTDPTRIDPDMGTEEELKDSCKENYKNVRWVFC